QFDSGRPGVVGPGGTPREERDPGRVQVADMLDHGRHGNPLRAEGAHECVVNVHVCDYVARRVHRVTPISSVPSRTGPSRCGGTAVKGNRVHSSRSCGWKGTRTEDGQSRAPRQPDTDLRLAELDRARGPAVFTPPNTSVSANPLCN